MSHPLRTPWLFSFQPYGPWSLTDIVQFTTVEAFWGAYEHMPRASLAFRVTDDLTRSYFKHGVERIRSLIMRRDSMKTLEWDDEDNKGMFVVVKDNLNGETLDKLYETLLLLAIGESFGDTCRAVRVIDKGGGKDQSVRTHFEVWCAAVEPKQVQDELRKVFGDTPFSWKSF